MAYYINTVNEGLAFAGSTGDGSTITLKWNIAYPNDRSNKIAYHIYFSTVEENVFTEGVKYVSIDGSLQVDIFDLTPGQLYHFAVRAVEYNPNVVNPALLPNAFNGLKIYPQSVLRNNISASDTIIPLLSTEDFPNFGIIQIGVEFINYLVNDVVNNNLILTNAMLQRGFDGTDDRFHDTDGYDGYNTWSQFVHFVLGREEKNTIVFPCQSRIDISSNSFTLADGYKQETKDILTTDLSASDAFNVGFASYDFAGYHRTDPVLLLTGACVGSYIGGEQFCADGYNGVGRMLRGLSFQEQNNQRQEILLSLDGEPVCLMRRQWTGIICNCYLPSSEYPDDRCPSCFVPGTLVRTEAGLRPIETIKVGDRVLSSDGQYYAVKRTFKSPYEGMLHSIMTSTTTSPILTTPEHPFAVMRGVHNNPNGCGPSSNCKAFIERGDGIDARPLDIRQVASGRWAARITGQDHIRRVLGTFDTKEEAEQAIIDYKTANFKAGHIIDWDDAKNIVDGDWLVSKWNKTTTDIDKIKVPQVFRKNTKLGEPRLGTNEFVVDTDFLWVIGMYLAEGSCSKRTINFALHKKEVEYQERIVRFFERYGYHPTVRASSVNGIVVEVNSTTLAQWFPRWLGRGCQNKHIPEELMSLPNEKSWAIIQGVYDGDGSKRDHEITQTSEILALQLVELLHRVGEQPLVRLQRHSTLTHKGNKRKLAYCVGWEEDTLKHHNRKGRWDFNGQLLSKTKNVSEVYYSGDVYNLEVEEDHTYIVQNILVHNCYGTKFVVGFQQYFNPRRSDGRIMVRFSPADDDLKQYEGGLESELISDCWTLTVPTIKDRDFIVRFDEDDNEEYRYEVLSVNRNRTLTRLEGAQKFRVQRVRKYDPIYQVKVFRNTQFFPSTISTSINSSLGILPHQHTIQISENITNVSQINQLTGVSQGHNHIVQNGIVLAGEVGHSHTIILP